MNRTILIVTLAVLAIITFLFFLRTSITPPPLATSPVKSAPPITLRVAYWKLPGFYLIHLADKMGYFKDEGLDIESFDLVPGTLPLQQKFASGELDAIAVSNSMFYSLDLVRHGIFGLVTYDPTDASVVMATGTITSPAQLKGKHLGVNSGNEFFLYWMLDKNGLKKSDVTINTDDFKSLSDKFKGGKYDAIFVVAPISSQLLKAGAGHIIYRAGDDLGLITAGMVFHDNLIAKNPGAVRKFNRAYFRAYQYSKDHHPEAIMETSKWLDLPEVDTAYAIDNEYFFPNIAENRAILRPGIGIKNLPANLNYMHLFLGGSNSAMEMTERVTDVYLPQ